MSLSRTWYDDDNYAASDTSTAQLLAKSILWGMKALLKGEVTGTNGASGAPPSGSRWTCEGSSDSSTASATDQSDRWTSSFDAAKIVRNTAGSAHSWIHLKSPAAMGPMYLLIDWSTAADTTITISASYNPFSTGGSTTAAPTSTGSWIYTAKTFNDGTATAHKLHRVTDADGNFNFYTSKNTSGLFHWMFGFQSLVETRPGDSYTKFTLFHYRVSNRGAGSNWVAADTSGFVTEKTTNGAPNTTVVMGGRTYDNAANAAAGLLDYAAHAAGAQVSWSINETQQNASDSKWDFLPVFVISTDTGKMGIRGRLPDVSMCSSGPAVGAGAPSAAAQDRTIVGNLVVPFGVAPSL